MDITGKLAEDERRAEFGEKDPDHMEKDCLKEIIISNYWQDYPAYSRSCDIYRKEKKVLEAQEAYKLPGSKENSRVQHSRKHLRLDCTEGESNQSR